MSYSRFTLSITLFVLYCCFSILVFGNTSTVVDVKDWKEEVLNLNNIYINNSEVLLKTVFTEPPVFAFDPTEDETITCMREYKGKLYIGSCTAPGLTDTGSIFVYDPESHTWEKAFKLNEQGVIRLEVYNETLYVPGYDANDGGWDLGNIYIYDGNTWVERRTVPRAVHTYGIAVYKGKIYLSADIFDQPPKDVSLTSGKVPIYGRVVSSADNGITWKDEYRGPTMGQDVGLITVFKDQIVLNARGDLVIFDGKIWRFLNHDNASFLYVLDYTIDRDLLLLGTPFGLCYYDGKRTWRSLIFDWGYIRGICKLGDYWVFAHYTLRDGFIYHGPTGTHSYPALKFGSQRPIFFGDITVIPDDILMHDAIAGRDLLNIDRTKMWSTGIKMFNINLVPTSACVCRGRVYIGTHPEGFILTFPVAKEGSIESVVYPVTEPGIYKIDWESKTPPGTSVRFQVRTSRNRQSIYNTEFTGPDGSPQTFFEIPGGTFKISEKGFIQYRAILTTNDPVKSPYLKRITITKQ